MSFLPSLPLQLSCDLFLYSVFDPVLYFLAAHESVFFCLQPHFVYHLVFDAGFQHLQPVFLQIFCVLLHLLRDLRVHLPQQLPRPLLAAVREHLRLEEPQRLRERLLQLVLLAEEALLFQERVESEPVHLLGGADLLYHVTNGLNRNVLLLVVVLEMELLKLLYLLKVRLLLLLVLH